MFGVKKVNRAYDYVLPTRPIRRARESLGNLQSNLKEIATELAERQSLRLRDDLYEEFRHKTPAERFAFLYEQGQWSEQELEQQKLAVRRAKLICLCGILFSLFGMVMAWLFLPYWMIIVMIPMSGSIGILMVANVMKFALYEVQLEFRELIDFKQFMSLPDFFVRLVA